MLRTSTAPQTNGSGPVKPSFLNSGSTATGFNGPSGSTALATGFNGPLCVWEAGIHTIRFVDEVQKRKLEVLSRARTPCATLT